MPQLEVISHSEDETMALAKKLSTAFLSGDVVVLKGPLGSGKTVFVRGLAKARGIDEALVNSPSFTMVNEYPGKEPVYHFDLYRMGDVSELQELGWEEYLSRKGITVIEWGERAGEELPEKYYLIEFSIVSEQERKIVISLQES